MEGTDTADCTLSAASKAFCPYCNSSHCSQSAGNIFIAGNILVGTIILKCSLGERM
jgi:hypothetical protein